MQHDRAPSLAEIPFDYGDICPIDELTQRYPNLFPTEHTARWQLRNRAESGLAPAVVRLGKKHGFIMPRYLAWLGATQRPVA